MIMENKETKRVLKGTSQNARYLHRDFHGALCYGIKYLDDIYGSQATSDYLRQMACEVYAPLIEAVKNKGLEALRQHWDKVFSLENGEFELFYEGEKLVLIVTKCPAVSHLKEIGQFFTHRFCETTVITNETICSQSGCKCTCDYEPGFGRCVQKFWKDNNI